jgi:hypothetical protein
VKKLANFEIQSPWFDGTAPVNAENATATLTFSGVVVDGETVTINGVTYEFDANSNVTSGNVAVDISEGTKAQATATLTFDGDVSDEETVTIGTEVYEFDTSGEAAITEGHIRVDVSGGATASDAVTALVAAINANTELAITATDGDGNTVVVACDAAGALDGSAGNAIAVDTDCADGSWGENVNALSGGSDATAAEAVTALVAALEDDANVTAADGDNDTVVITAKIAGVVGNDITVAETCANATWGVNVTKLSGGVDCTEVTVPYTMLQDDSYYYVNIAPCGVHDKNWRRFQLAEY